MENNKRYVAGGRLWKDRLLSKLSPILSFKKPVPKATVNTKVLFSDVSFYQGNIDWDIMATKSPAVIIRAGQNLWIDPKFVRNYSEAKRVGMKRGTYWYYDSRIHPDDQADILIGLIQKDLPEMEVWCDWEGSFGGNYGDLPYAVRFMQKVENSLPGVIVGMYTGYYWFKDHSSVTSNMIDYEYLQDKPLWLAWYTSNPDYVKIPAPWTELTHWQFSEVGDGQGWGTETLGLDLNYFNGTLAEFSERYDGSIEPPVDPPVGGDMEETVYNNGVTKITGNKYGSDYTVTVIPPESTQDASYAYKTSTCRYVDEIDGFDFLCNFTPFTGCRPNLGLRMGGKEITPYVDYNPYLTLDGVPKITHVKRQFKNYSEASQAFRYVIENSARSPLVSADWLNLEPRRLVGTKSDGSLVSILVKGRDDGNMGWTLYDAAEFGLSLGLNMLVDADSGSSVQEYLVVNGEKIITYGVGADRSQVAVFLGVKFNEPIVVETPNPDPDPDPTEVAPIRTVIELDDGSQWEATDFVKLP